MPSSGLGIHSSDLFFVQYPTLAAKVPTMLCFEQHAMHPDEACWTLVPETSVKLVPPKCTGLTNA